MFVFSWILFHPPGTCSVLVIGRSSWWSSWKFMWKALVCEGLRAGYPQVRPTFLWLIPRLCLAVLTGLPLFLFLPKTLSLLGGRWSSGQGGSEVGAASRVHRGGSSPPDTVACASWTACWGLMSQQAVEVSGGKGAYHRHLFSLCHWQANETRF